MRSGPIHHAPSVGPASTGATARADRVFDRMAWTLVADQAPACSSSGAKQEGSHELHQKHHAQTVAKLVGLQTSLWRDERRHHRGNAACRHPGIAGFGCASPEVQGRHSTCNCQSCAKFACVPESWIGIAYQTVEDARDDNIVTDTEHRGRPHAVRLQPKPRKHEAGGDNHYSRTAEGLPTIRDLNWNSSGEAKVPDGPSVPSVDSRTWAVPVLRPAREFSPFSLGVEFQELTWRTTSSIRSWESLLKVTAITAMYDRRHCASILVSLIYYWR